MLRARRRRHGAPSAAPTGPAFAFSCQENRLNFSHRGLRKVCIGDNLFLLILNLNNNSGRWRLDPLDSWSELMKKSAWYFLAALAVIFVLLPFSSVRAVSPYTENFPTTTANWISPSEPATFVPSGGPDGS